MRRRLPRLRIRLSGWPRRALVVTDTPHPDCPHCEGDGGIESFYGDDDTGEYTGSDWDPCDCWNPQHRWRLLPLPYRPRWLRRSIAPGWPSGYSNEPPF